MTDLPEKSPTGRHGRGRPRQGRFVLLILVVTCAAMLVAIYWIVRTGKL